MEADDKDPKKGGGGAAGVRIFFKSIFQSVLLFGAETWVLTPHMGWVLGGFQYQVAQQLTGHLPRKQEEGERE